LRCFLHIAEFGFEGYRYLPGLATISDDLVLWAPAALQAQQAKEAGASLVGPEEILGLVEAGKIRIVGREPYLMEKSSRKNGWPLAQWTSSFDEEIATIAAKDLDQPIEERRVFFAGPEQGGAWAREELLSEGPRLNQVEDLISADKALDPMDSNLLPGLVEKLTRLSSKEQRVAFALRDIRNHTLAAEEIDADVSVEPLAFREIVADLTRENRPKGTSRVTPPSLDGTRELLEIVMSLAPLENSSDLKRLLELKELPSVRLQIESLLHFNPRPRERLKGELEAAGELTHWLSTMMDSSTAKGMLLLDVIGVVLAMLTEQPAIALTSPLTRLGCAAAEAAQQHADYESRMDAPIQYAGMSLPFILAFRDETVTFNRIGELRHRLEEGLRTDLI
jgi:hypothetical protein